MKRWRRYPRLRRQAGQGVLEVRDLRIEFENGNDLLVTERGQNVAAEVNVG